MRAAIIAVLVSVLGLLGCAASAAASASASSSAPSALKHAVVRQNQLDSAQARCQHVTISRKDPTWAKLSWPAHMSHACQKIAGNGSILEHRVGGAWRFAAVGSDIHCPVKDMPAAVERQLKACAPLPK